MSEDVVTRLAQAAKSRHLARNIRDSAEKLRARLTAPVRVTLMGPGRTDRRAVINALLEEALLPTSGRLPSVEIEFAERARVEATLPNGKRQDMASLDAASLEALSPALLQIQAPNPFLRDVTLLDVVTDGSPKQLVAASKWAATRTDILIWVTSDFNDEDQQLWSLLPTVMKYYCFLVLTPASGARGQMPRLTKAQLDAFRGVLLLRFGADGKVCEGPDLPQFHGALEKCVSLGRQADFDRALMFLQRHVPSWDVTPGDTADAKDQPSEALAGFDAFDGGRDPLGEEGHRNTIEQQREALDLIRINAQEILEKLDRTEIEASEYVTAQCGRTIELVRDKVTDIPPLYDATMQAADYLLLLEMEADKEEAGIEAITALLQLKRALETSVSA